MSGDSHGGGIFLTWHRHQRTTQIGARTGIPVVVLSTHHTGIRRYLSLVHQTVATLRKRRPSWLIVQSPSYVLAALAVTIGRRYTRAVLVDAHNEAVRPYINDTDAVRWLARAVMRRATAVIVTNEELADDVRACGGCPIVLPDPLPTDVPSRSVDLGPGRHIAVILTYSPDEPVNEVLEAARVAPAGLTFHLTGAVERASAAIRATAPKNVRFTGFLSEADYWQLLHSVDAVMDLTKMPDCLVCAAYEAVAAGVPSILSDNPAGRRLFSGAAVFIEPTQDAIERVVAELDGEVSQARHRVEAVAKSYASAWDEWAGRLLMTLRAYETT